MNGRVSIIVPTYKRKKYLMRLMKSLVRAKTHALEIIVVEQAEENFKFYIRFAKKYKLHLRYVYLKMPSTAKAMNKGAKLAKGKYILFLDDDVTVRKGILRAYKNNFKDQTVAAVVGRSITRGQEIDIYRKNTGRITWFGHFTDGFSSNIHQEVDTVIGCNMCWRKDFYIALGGIDEQFTGNALRLESDLSLRAKKKGYKIYFEPKAVVDHYRAEIGGARKTEGRLQWYFDFFSNEVYFFLKHWNQWLLPIFLFSRIEWMLRCMFGFGREVSIRSIATPLEGIIDGIYKYRAYLHTYDYRR